MVLTLIAKCYLKVVNKMRMLSKVNDRTIYEVATSKNVLTDYQEFINVVDALNYLNETCEDFMLISCELDADNNSYDIAALANGFIETFVFQ